MTNPIKQNAENAKPPKPSTLRLRVSATAETIVRGGHPWLYSESIREQNRPGQPGDLAVIYDRSDRFLAIGLFDPLSPIRVRVLHAGKPVTLDEAWWRERLRQALEKRRGVFDASTTGYRCVNGESDGWPGLVLDRYAGTAVLKIYTAAWMPRLDDIVALLKEEIPVERLVLRMSRNIQETASKDFGLRDGQILFGEPLGGPVVFEETGIRFEADVLKGQKTGFFLDQRENRRQVETLATGKDVLNAFSFSGGFSLYGARGGAKSVTDLDISAHALRSSERNFSLNQHFPAVAACRHEIVQADAFDWLKEERRRRFDLIILDPPSLAKRESEKPGALRAYGELISAGIGLLKPNGVLVAASCSAHVTAEDFFEVARHSSTASRLPWKELMTTRHAPDHPADFKEAEYLKAVFLRFRG